MGTTIKDIAQKADVSPATVSLVLNNKPGVGDITRRRILKLAEEMEYSGPRRSSTSAAGEGTIRFLKIARHGHIVNRDHNVFISDYIDGIIQAAKALDYKTEVTSFRTTPIEEIVATVASEADLAGAIVLGTELNREDVITFQRTSIPLVFIDTFLDYVPFDFVDMNNNDSVFRVIKHLLQNGHGDIGIVRSSVRTRNFSLRDRAFREGMRALGLTLNPRYVFDAYSTFSGAYEDMLGYLQRGAALPTALFCTNDTIAFGVLKALREHGVRVPQDISVVGFDDLPTAALLDPPLTSIAVSKREIGSTAMRRLDARIRGGAMPPTKIVVGGTLIKRSSVARVGEPIHAVFHDPDEDTQPATHEEETR
ncbi:MAG: LacI family DNA-binding transcriptional regulator [Alkalispirochaeta sp.]